MNNGGRFFMFACIVFAAFAAMACSGKPIMAADSVTGLAASLEAAGLKVTGPQDNNPLDARIFEIPGVFYSAGGEKILAYEFASAEEAETVMAGISPDGYGIGTKYVNWGGTPHIHANGRLIVVYVGDTIKIKETLAAAMGEQIAGEP